MRLKRKKGFTMIELIVVVAVIGVLLAVILPMVTSTESNKIRVTDAAKDFYVASQHVFAKFAKYEADITKQDTSSNAGEYVMCYDKEFGGNRPIGNYLFVYLHFENGRITESSAYSAQTAEFAMAQVLARNNRVERALVEDGTYEAMLNDGDATTNPPPSYRFLKMFMDEMNALFDASDGFYYALVEYDKTLNMSASNPTVIDPNATAGNNVLKVVMAGYGDYELPQHTGVTDVNPGDFESYKTANLLVTELGVISNGDYFGIQSSELYGSDYIGEAGTYFAI